LVDCELVHATHTYAAYPYKEQHEPEKREALEVPSYSCITIIVAAREALKKNMKSIEKKC
jgi:hypothetical protein